MYVLLSMMFYLWRSIRVPEVDAAVRINPRHMDGLPRLHTTKTINQNTPLPWLLLT